MKGKRFAWIAGGLALVAGAALVALLSGSDNEPDPSGAHLLTGPDVVRYDDRPPVAAKVDALLRSKRTVLQGKRAGRNGCSFKEPTITVGPEASALVVIEVAYDPSTCESERVTGVPRDIESFDEADRLIAPGHSSDSETFHGVGSSNKGD